MPNLFKLLQLVTEKIPPGNKQKHRLELNDDNNVLVLYLFLGKHYLPIWFEEGDFEKPTDEMLAEVYRLYAESDLFA